MAINGLITNAAKSKKIWIEKVLVFPELETMFHLRPVAKGVTLVTTHPSRRLNGLSSLPYAKLEKALNSIIEKRMENFPYERILDDLQFTSRNKRELVLERDLIRALLGCDDALLTRIKTELQLEKITFIASELIVQEEMTKGGHRLDILFLGDEALYFAELKTDQNKKDDPTAQVRGNKDRYENNPAFYELLREYPVADDLSKITMGVTPIRCLVVKGDVAENMTSVSSLQLV